MPDSVRRRPNHAAHDAPFGAEKLYSGASPMKAEVSWCCLVTLGYLCHVHPSVAGDAPTAEALFRAGRDATARGDNAAACQRFRESYRIEPAVGTLLNIAICDEALHRLADAWEGYQHVADRLAADDDRVPLVRERIAALDVRLPRLTLRANRKAPPGEVQRDGVALTAAAFGVPLPVDPGQHRIVVRAPQREVREYVVLVAEGQRVTVDIEPGPPAAAPGTRVAGSVPFRQQAEYSLFGAGIASLVVTGVTAAMFFHADATLNEHCPTSSQCDDVGLQAAGSADRLRTVALVSGAISLAAFAGGITLHILNSGDRKTSIKRGGRLFIGVGAITAQFRF